VVKSAHGEGQLDNVTVGFLKDFNIGLVDDQNFIRQFHILRTPGNKMCLVKREFTELLAGVNAIDVSSIKILLVASY